MSASRKLLLAGGLALAIWSMSYGLWYAVFAEHQDLDTMGGSVTAAFVHAAERKIPDAQASLDAYAETRFRYVRSVDVHSHWGGLALLLIVFGVIFDRVGFKERKRLWLAAMLVVSAIIFPLGVALEVANRGAIPKTIAVLGVALVTVALAAISVGFARGERLGRP